jgi:AcrR family transcriptional regulator
MSDVGVLPEAQSGPEAIIEAARDLIAEGGLEAVSMRAVAERVGVSAAALYHHFANKQALIDQVVSRAFERFGGEMEAAAQQHPVGSLERVAALGEAYVQFSVENEAYFRVIFSIAAPNPRELEELPHGAGYPLLRQSIVDAMATGAMRQADPDLMAHYLWANVHGIVTLALSCRLDQCEQCRGIDEPIALQLFHAFGPLLRAGIEAPGGAGGAP